MALPLDPEQMPATRNWHVLSAFEPLPFSPDYLQSLAKISTDPEVPGHSDIGIRNLLFILVLGLRPQTVLEVGGHIGSASLVIGEALRLNDFGHLHVLEPGDTYFQKLSQYVAAAKLQPWITPIHGFSYEENARRQLQSVAPFELIFIDACHDYRAVREEIEFLLGLLRQDGLLVFHDSGVHAQNFDSEKRGGVRAALLDACADHPILRPVFFEYPLWLNRCGAAILCKQNLASTHRRQKATFGLKHIKFPFSKAR